MQAQTVVVHLGEDEVSLLIDALDSHEYWQLSEPHQRNDGYSTVEDGESGEIDAVRTLIAKLEKPLRSPHEDIQPPWRSGGSHRGA